MVYDPGQHGRTAVGLFAANLGGERARPASGLCLACARRRGWLRQAAAVALFLLAAVLPVSAHDGEPVHDQYLERLERPDLPPGHGCCGGNDCKPVEYRIRDGHYEALINAAAGFGGVPPGWILVPEAKIIRDPAVVASNPFGQALACWLPTIGIMCFVLPSAV